jgi:hypothetical protein
LHRLFFFNSAFFQAHIDPAARAAGSCTNPAHHFSTLRASGRDPGAHFCPHKSNLYFALHEYIQISLEKLRGFGKEKGNNF